MGSKVYSGLVKYRELYESRFEAIVTIIELLLPVVGIAAFVTQIRSEFAPERILLHWHESIELLVFIFILVFALSRFIVTLRRLWLGYRFGGLPRTADGDFDIAGILARVRCIGWGSEPGAQPDGVGRLQEIAAKIADRSARMTSDGSIFSRDLRWAERERDALSQWFTLLPESLWQLSTMDGSPTTRIDGYFSVIVPITEASWRSIRHGMRATDLAELDPEAVNAISTGKWIKTDSSASRVRLLAYVHIFCEPDELVTVDEVRLLAVSMQHIAFLLEKLFGQEEMFIHRWNFGLMCESANTKQGQLLSQLGLNQFSSQGFGTAGRLRGPARSAQGFDLFECVVTNGEPQGESTRASARQFVSTIEHMVRCQGRH